MRENGTYVKLSEPGTNLCSMHRTNAPPGRPRGAISGRRPRGDYPSLAPDLALFARGRTSLGWSKSLTHVLHGVGKRPSTKYGGKRPTTTHQGLPGVNEKRNWRDCVLRSTMS